VPAVDLVDETFVVAEPALVAAAVHDPRRWHQWWPDLRLTVFQDRGTAGLRWSCTGALVGSCELWLEPWGDGVIVHHYLRADPARQRRGRAAVRLRERRAAAWKRCVHALKDELEGDRQPGSGSPGSSSPADLPTTSG